MKKTEEQMKQEIIQDEKGTMYWIYEMPMMKNPTLVITTMKVLAIASCAPALLVFILSLMDGEGLGAFVTLARVFAIVFLIFCALMILAYPILAAGYGWHYIVMFIMDEHGVTHRQLDKQAEKANALAALVSALGNKNGKPGMIGQGILAGSHTELSSSFAMVTKIKGKRSRHVIYLDEGLFHNQVYVREEDYDFVYNYIVDHCPKADVR